jgi:hypothetical protein
LEVSKKKVTSVSDNVLKNLLSCHRNLIVLKNCTTLVYKCAGFWTCRHVFHNLVPLASYWCASWRVSYQSRCPIDSWLPLQLSKLKTSKLFFAENLLHFLFSPFQLKHRQPPPCSSKECKVFWDRLLDGQSD